MVLALAIGIAAIATDPLPENAQKELQRLQGKWILISGERNGKTVEFPKDDPVTLIVEIKGDKWLLGAKGDDKQADKGRIVMIDTKTNPKCMDLKSTEKGVEGTMIESIYRLEGDTLTIASYQGTYNGKQRTRPTEFKSTDNDTIVMIMKRQKEKQ